MGPGPLIDEDMSSISRSPLSSVDCYVLGQVLLGADMGEVVGSEVVEQMLSKAGHLLKVDVMEVYSPERVAALCKDFNL